MRRSLGRVSSRSSRAGLVSAAAPVHSDARPPSSSERTPLRKASWKVRPMAITSPIDFIWVVSVRSASGNFSKFHRGIFTTT